MPEVDERDRGRGILSQADREYLRGDKEYSKATERNRRTEIRKRVINAIKDFELLADELQTRDREQVFDQHNESALFNRGIEKGLYFLYLGVRYSELEFDYLLEEAIESAEYDHQRQKFDQVVDVETEFSVEVTEQESIDEVIDRLREEDSMTASDLFLLSTASKERDQLEEPLEIDEVVLDDESFLAELSDPYIYGDHVLPMLERWHEDPTSVEFVRK